MHPGGKPGMKFGTSGLRGLVAEMTDAVCESYARGLRRVTFDAEGAPIAEMLIGQGSAAEFAEDRRGLCLAPSSRSA